MTQFANAPRHSADKIKQFTDAGYWNDDIVPDYVRGWAEREPDRVALRTPELDITFGEYYAASLRLANSLLGLGLKKGDVVGIQMPNVPDYLIAYLGVTMMGGVLATMHMPYRGRRDGTAAQSRKGQSGDLYRAAAEPRCPCHDARTEGQGVDARACPGGRQ